MKIKPKLHCHHMTQKGKDQNKNKNGKAGKNGLG